MTTEERRAEYEICVRRGHQPGNQMVPSSPPMNICKWCGTYYRYENVLREQGAPEKP